MDTPPTSSNDDVIQRNGTNISNIDILAQLCVDAEKSSTDVRDCLRAYNLKSSTKHLKSLFNSFNKPIIVKSLQFLNVNPENWNKDVCVLELICRIQNLLIDKCQFCHSNYATKNDQPLLLQCHLCGQNAHDTCLKELLGDKYTEDLQASDVNSLLNPFNIETMHFLCSRCSKDTIPQHTDKAMKRPSAETIESVSQVESGGNSNDKDNVSHHGADAKDPVNKKKKLCHFYARGSCKYGKLGVGCNYDHPKYCQHLLSHGRKGRKGCDKGDDCNDFHPKMCYSSLRKHECYNNQCRYFHVKGTKRVHPAGMHGFNYNASPLPNPNLNPVSTSSDGYSQMNNEQQSARSSKGFSNDHFLSMFKQLREDLFQALDYKVSTILQNSAYPNPNVIPQDHIIYPPSNYQQQTPVLNQSQPPVASTPWELNRA